MFQNRSRNVIIAIVAGIIILVIGILVFMSNQNQSNPSSENTQVTLSNGLQIKVTKTGSGKEAKKGDKISVNYEGRLNNSTGSKFDSSFDRSEPFGFQVGVGQVIQGWDQGILANDKLGAMKEGESRELTIPAELGYGARGAGRSIPPNSVLFFKVDLIKVG